MSQDLWEYRVVNQTDNPIENQAKLNRLGKEGWELVAVSPLGHGGILAAFLKRLRNSNGTTDQESEETADLFSRSLLNS